MKSATQVDLTRFLAGLRSRNEDHRYKSAKELKRFVTGDLKESTTEDYNWFVDNLCAELSIMVNHSDINERKGAVIGMGCIADVDFMTMHSQYLKFANQVQNMGVSSDIQLTALQARLIGQFGLILTNDYIEGQIKRACEILVDDNKPDSQKQFSTMTLREIGLHTPTSFFQHVSLFIDAIKISIRDKQMVVREMSAMALRSAFTVTAERESGRRKERSSAPPIWYTEVNNEAFKPPDEAQETVLARKLNKDDWAHGSMLLLNEMLSCANEDHELIRLEMENMAGQPLDQLVMVNNTATTAIRTASTLRWPMSPAQEQIMKQRSLVVSSYACKSIMTERYSEAWSLVQKNLNQRNSHMIPLLLQLLPRLAGFQPKEFKNQYLKETMDFLIACLRKERDRPLVFVAVGFIAFWSKQEFTKRGFLAIIMPHIKANLPGKESSKKRSPPLETSLFLCISLLTKAVGSSMFSYVKEMLDSILATGLSQPLTECLRVLASGIPELKKDIQDGLLKTLSRVLMHRSQRQTTTPSSAAGRTSTIPGREVVMVPVTTPETQDTACISLAQRTLGTFDFEGHSLTHFVRHTASNFISFVTCEHKEVRLEAVRTCSHLMTPLLRSVSRLHQASRTSLNTVSDILNKLLVVATSDPERDVRLCVLESLDERFDPHLAQAGHLDSLFIALHDEDFEIRVVAMRILGRLSAINPACVQPSLRRVLLQILTELEHSGSTRNKEQSARLLANLLSTAPRFIQPYAQPLMIALMPRLRCAYPPASKGDSQLALTAPPITGVGGAVPSEPTSVLVAIFKAVGELAQVSGYVLTKYIEELFPILTHMMQDSSSYNKREIAVWTMGQLVTNTGYVVLPYEKNADLLIILLLMLKNEEAKAIRREVIRVLGLIGALDPFKLKIYSGAVDSVGDTGIAVSVHETVERQEVEMTQAELLVNMSSWVGRDEFFAACSMSALMQVLRDPALRSQYDKVVQSIIFVFKALGNRSVQYLRQVMPDYLRCLREGQDARLKAFLIHQLGAIMDIVRIHIKEFMGEIVDLVLANWRVSLEIQVNSISLMRNMVNALNTEFKPFLARLLPQILRVLNHETNDIIVKGMLDILPDFGYNLEEYIHILVPAIVRILDQEEANVEVKRAALEAIARLTDGLELDDLAGRIVQPVCRLLERQPELHAPAMDTLTSLLVRMGQKFMVLLPLVLKTLNKTKIQHAKFTKALNKVGKSAYLRTMEEDLSRGYQSAATTNRTKQEKTPDNDSAPIRPQILNPVNLQRAWHSSKIVAREDWNQWLRTFSTALLRESPSPAIRACSGLSTVTPSVAKTLFNAAFVSCWPELTDHQQDELITTLELALSVHEQTEVSQTVLNLAEFTAHCDKSKLPLNTSLLADRAMKNRAYAKALYYKEQEFLEQQNSGDQRASQATLSALLSINKKLQLEEAASGVLIYATKIYKDKLEDEEAWYEKLHNWTRALNLYERKLEDERKKDNTNLLIGRMRCLRSLGEWQQLNGIATDRWDGLSENCRQKMAPISANAAWALGDWENMSRYVEVVPKDSYDGCFLRGVLAVHKDRFDVAQDFIDRARDILDADLTAMAGESYNRAYDDIVCAQMLSELEEVFQYKLVSDRRPVLRQAWQDRLLGCQSVVEDWCQILQIRSLVIRPQEDIKTWLRFAGLCRRSGRMNLSRHVIELLLGSDPDRSDDSQPEIIFSYTKHLWASGPNYKLLAVDRLTKLIEMTLKPIRSQERETLEREGRLDDYKYLLAKCCLKLGSWYSELKISHSAVHAGTDCDFEKHQSNVIRCYRTASEEWPALRAAWQNWAMANYTAVNYLFRRFTLIGDAEERVLAEIQRQQTSTASYPSCSPHPASASTNPAPSTTPTPPGTLPAPTSGQQAPSTSPNTYSQHQTILRLSQQQHLKATQSLISPHSKGGSTFGQAAGVMPTPPTAAPQPAQSSLLPVVPEGSSLQQQLAQLEASKRVVQEAMEAHSGPAVRGFVNSISLSASSNLQDSLRLIKLLFEFGHLQEIRETIREGLNKINLENWLLVIQQLLARIDTTKEHVASIIVDLLITVGKKHPQAMINPLILAFKSGGSDRRRYNANKILYSMEEHSAKLVSEGFLLNEELIRLAITFMEMWHECLEDASRVYFGDRDIKKMFKLLHPLHSVMDRPPETLNETAFHQDYYGELNSAKEWCIRYEMTGNSKELQQAWEVYYNLYRKLAKHESNVTMLELTCASPRLDNYGNDWVLAVPGSYEPNRPLVTIAGLKNTLTFITSKQHPRKMSFNGSDGQSYMFLLKGHEDIRQDERVMQFFGLANTLLMNNPETFRRNLTIQRMSVIPLSTNTGLIGWVPSSDTLHSLIRDQREKSKVLLNQEHRVMLKMAPDFDRLNVMQKTEVFEQGLKDSNGRDLANILWLKSHSSEAWFERRTNFIRSLATMSMIGYILGLGDRHPSNIMLCRESGKVIHIDFGDCFEVAMMRDKFPEKVPFRLTRMIIEAMEVTGIDGTFRQTCEQVLELMRTNRESLLAVLEAFIHDPLLQWVLLENRKDFTEKKPMMRQQMPMPAGQNQQMQGQPVFQAAAVQPGAMQDPTLAQRQTHLQQQVRGQPIMDPTQSRLRRSQSRSGMGGPMQAAPQMKLTLDHGYPDSASLRNPNTVNPWRHHLCNGPWLGSYANAKKMRKQTENGTIIVERNGMQGFIFSAKPPSEDRRAGDPDEQDTNANTRAMAVMAHIHNKLNGGETGRNMNAKEQVEMIIRQATSNQNLCQMYIGWCAFW